MRQPTVRPQATSAAAPVPQKRKPGYVFRGIDRDLWRQARARCLSQNVKFLDVVETLIRGWLRTTSDEPRATSAPAEDRYARERD